MIYACVKSEPFLEIQVWIQTFFQKKKVWIYINLGQRIKENKGTLSSLVVLFLDATFNFTNASIIITSIMSPRKLVNVTRLTYGELETSLFSFTFFNKKKP